jgi:hypothetical protein
VGTEEGEPRGRFIPINLTSFQVALADSARCILLLIPSWWRASRRRFFVIPELRGIAGQFNRATQQPNYTAKSGHTKPDGKGHQTASYIRHRTQDVRSSPAGHVVQGDEQEDNQT